MARSCSYIPHNKRGEELKGFQNYRRELGYLTAAKVFTQVLAPSFQEKYKRTLEKDAQGVPTYESAMRVPYVKNLVGTAKLINTEQKQFPYVDNTRENYQRLVLSAHSFNQNADNKDKLVAVVIPSSDSSQLRIEIRERNEANMKAYQNQYSTSQLNQRLTELLGDLGVNISLLERNELTDGFVDFSKASSIADGFAGLINIANGMEGELSLSEEFSHLLIDMLWDTPLVQRSLNVLAGNDALVREILGDEYEQNVAYYTQNPNHDILGSEMPLNMTLAEEALGRVLQRNLKTSSDTDAYSSPESKSLKSLVSRIISYIKRMFKGLNSDDITQAKNAVDIAMGELAKEVLTGTVKLSKDEIIRNRRNARFNHLRESTDKVISLLKSVDEIERKRSKMVPKEDRKGIEARVLKLEAAMTDAKKMEGLHNYAKWALQDLQEAMNKMVVSGTLESTDFTSLRHTKSVLDSYTNFINDFHELLDSFGEEGAVFIINGQDVDLRELWRDINDLYKSCTSEFKKIAFAAFSDFLAPVYEKSPLRNEDGSIKPLEEVLIAEEFDITEFDRWLTSMGNSSSLLLQLYNKTVNNAKDKARLKTMHDVRSIWKIRENAEKRGITSFEWMFEKDAEGHKTGNYISPINYGQYDTDKKEMEQKLIEKYGKNPVGEDFKKAFAERKAWYASHAEFDLLGNSMPGRMYKNDAYNKLSQAQRDTLNEFLAYKDELEKQIPRDKRSHIRAIQRRRNNAQRLIDAVTNPAQAYESIKTDVKDAFRTADDDELLYGESSKGLTDFTGKEYLTLPILYTNRLKNPDTLSTDVFSDLMVYAYMTNTYTEISSIYDPLEIGTDVLAQKDFVKNSGTKTKEEILNVLGRTSKKPVKIGSNTNFEKKLRDYLECQVYGRYFKEDDVFGKDAQKTLSVFQRLTSTAYLGCNYLAGLASIFTAVGMQNIEAFSGEFFNKTQLLKADAKYFEMLPAFVAELADRNKQSKLALFDELFDVKQNAKDKMHNVQMKNIVQRFFGKNWLFIQQGLGDHWIYNRTAIAMAMKKKVKVGGKIMSVWDALEVVTDENGYKYMKVKDGAMNVDKDGNTTDAFDVGYFSREIAHINHTIAGIYNDDDQNAANRVVLGRLIQQMRKWIVPQFMRRFQSKRMILDIGKEEEGYYRTAYRLSRDIWKSGFKITAEWDKLNDSKKANVKRALTEIIQTYALWFLVHAISGGAKDPDRSWALQLVEYYLNREVHELGFLTPGPLMLTEGYKTVTSPFVAASAANKVAELGLSLIVPGNWFPDDDHLIQSGRYEGHGHIYKNLMELPIPPLTQVRQLDKFFDDLDTGIRYYSRDYK